MGGGDRYNVSGEHEDEKKELPEIEDDADATKCASCNMEKGFAPIKIPELVTHIPQHEIWLTRQPP